MSQKASIFLKLTISFIVWYEMKSSRTASHKLRNIQRIIRKTFWQAVEGLPFTYEPSIHTDHCFDAIRQVRTISRLLGWALMTSKQSIQCNADSTPLYTFGDNTAGNKQIHMCRDWNALRDFASKHTACYKDSVHPIPLGDHFGFCDNGTDRIHAPKQEIL